MSAAPSPRRDRRVTISFARSPDHRRAIGQLTRLLHDDGFDLVVDLTGDRPQLTRRELRLSDKVLVVADDSDDPSGDGPGGRDRPELAFLRSELIRDADDWRDRIVPVVLPGQRLQDLPPFLRRPDLQPVVLDRLDRDGASDLLTAVRRGRAIRGTMGLLGRLPLAGQDLLRRSLRPPADPPPPWPDDDAHDPSDEALVDADGDSGAIEAEAPDLRLEVVERVTGEAARDLRRRLEPFLTMVAGALLDGAFDHDEPLRDRIQRDRNYLHAEVYLSDEIDSLVAAPVATRLLSTVATELPELAHDNVLGELLPDPDVDPLSPEVPAAAVDTLARLLDVDDPAVDGLRGLGNLDIRQTVLVAMNWMAPRFWAAADDPLSRAGSLATILTPLAAVAGFDAAATAAATAYLGLLMVLYRLADDPPSAAEQDAEDDAEDGHRRQDGPGQ